MTYGIRIQDATLEISPEGLRALASREGADVRLTRLDLSISPEALNTLLRGLAPEGCAPAATLAEGGLRLDATCDGKRFALELQVGAFRIELAEGGVRIVSE